MGSVVTHQNWRGQFARGTWGEGTGRVGQSSGCTGTWPQQTPCVPVAWPGWNTGAWHDEAAKPQTVGTDTYWLGSLSVGMRDASGQMYMRNRYYNPETGQFTQPDPIGLAGGLNSYGFAAGDPVSYSDPYGLCPICAAAIGVWAVIEVASSIYDAYDAVSTTVRFASGNASGTDLGVSYGGIVAGVVAPGPGTGYGRAAREFIQHGDEPAAIVADVGARRMRNAHLAGQNHPSTGIPFDAQGFPDFSGVSTASTNITFSGNRATDVKNANAQLGFDRTPAGHVWHHHQNGTTMQLVPEGVHRKTGHTGGHSLNGGNEEEE